VKGCVGLMREREMRIMGMGCGDEKENLVAGR